MKKSRILIAVVLFAMFLGGCSTLSGSSDFVNTHETSVPKTEELSGMEKAPDTPERIHLSWTATPATTMTIAWQTGHVESGAVFYRADGMTEPVRIDADENSSFKAGSGIIHELTLTSLDPGTLYHYRCGSDEGGWSEYRSFMTAPEEMPFKFAVLGDTQNFRDVKRRVVAHIKAKRPLFIVQCGDMVNFGGDKKLWNEWLDDMQDLISEIPMMPVMGNHDDYCVKTGGLCPGMFERFALPDNGVIGKKEYWYSFDAAGSHFTMLNSEKEAGIEPDTDQYKWLEKDLEKSTGSRWKFAFMHKPPFSMGIHGDDKAVKKNWVPLFDRYGVEMVFSGHEHLYERTKPLKGCHPDDGGTVYIVSGSSGSVLYPTLGDLIKSPDSYYEKVSSRFCFIIVNVYPGHVNVDVIGLKENGDGTEVEDIIDSFTVSGKPTGQHAK